MVPLVMIVAIESYFLNFLNIFLIFLEYDILKHKIMFEDRKVRDKEQQIKFSGHPFVILGNNLLDCTHGVNHHLSRKKRSARRQLKER